jgi:subtilisin-like proprotein convertase family protein
MISRSMLSLGAWLLASLVVVTELPAEIITFSNTALISIPTSGLANPYPSVIPVSGVNGTVTNFSLTLNRFSHAYVDDVAAAVVSPSGQAVLLFSGTGPNADDVRNGAGATRVTNQTWTFDDNSIRGMMPQQTLPTSGSYKPGLWEYDDSFPTAGNVTVGLNYGFNFSPFLNRNPNGNWMLLVMDSNAGDAGAIAGGWSMTFNITTSSVPEPSTAALTCLGFTAIAWRKRRVALAWLKA